MKKLCKWLKANKEGIVTGIMAVIAIMVSVIITVIIFVDDIKGLITNAFTTLTTIKAIMMIGVASFIAYMCFLLQVVLVSLGMRYWKKKQSKNKREP